MSLYRRAARRDANEQEIIDALEAIGASVQTISERGVPDLLVGYRGRNWLIEVKDGSKPPSKRKLNAEQEQWHRAWRGQVRVVSSVDAAVALVSWG